MTTSRFSNNTPTTLTPHAIFGGVVMTPPTETRVEIALVSIIFTKQQFWVVDHCELLLWETFQPMLPIWWFRYLMLTGSPPSIAILRDVATPISFRLDQMASEATDATPLLYPFTGIGYYARFQEFYRAIHPEWTPIEHSADFLIMRFRGARTYAPILHAAPLQFRNYQEQHSEVYGSLHLQAAIGITLYLHDEIIGPAECPIITGHKTHPRFPDHPAQPRKSPELIST